jgi:two-component system sensor histidine kinase TctE
MTRAFSLRARLTAIILLPLLVVAFAVGFWELTNARRTANGVFDRSLLSAALAVANDVTISGGDALSAKTRDVLSDTSGGQVFYHVYAPDGVIVAGYATPPVGIPRTPVEAAGPRYFEAVYLGRDVHGARLQTSAQIDGFSGIFTTTVWQDAIVRDAFVRDLLSRSVLAISGLIGALGFIVWFGVRLGLRPLLDLENAIARRSSDELNAIQRSVPQEVEGIVSTLNRLFDQVSRSMTAQSEFISNAAHQLKNPIAGVLSLAEAVNAAPMPEETKTRAKDLLQAAQETSDLSQKLLLLERAKSISPTSAMEVFELGPALKNWVQGMADAARDGVNILNGVPDDLGSIRGDPTMLREAVQNLVDNAFLHGGPDLTVVQVEGQRRGAVIVISVSDDGIGIPKDLVERAKTRFAQIATTSGSGLGVSIAEAVAEGHGGEFELVRLDKGLRAELHLPLAF